MIRCATIISDVSKIHHHIPTLLENCRSHQIILDQALHYILDKMYTPHLSNLIHTDHQQLQLLAMMYTIKLSSLFMASTAQKQMNGFNHWWKPYLMRYGGYFFFVVFLFLHSGRVTRRVPLVEQKLVTLPKHLGSSPIFSGVSIA